MMETRNKSAKVVLALFVIVVFLFLYMVLFVLRTPWNPGLTPPTDSNILWISDNPDMWFKWVDDVGAIGEIKNDNEAVEIIVQWGGPSPRIAIYRYTEQGVGDCLASGSCKFFESEGTIWISKDYSNIFKGVESISFVGRQGDGPFVLTD